MENFKLLPMWMVFAYFLKLMILTPIVSFNDALLLFCLIVYVSVLKVLDNSKKNNAMMNKIELLEQKYKEKAEVLDTLQTKTAKDIDDLKTQMASVKIGHGFRQIK